MGAPTCHRLSLLRDLTSSDTHSPSNSRQSASDAPTSNSSRHSTNTPPVTQQPNASTSPPTGPSVSFLSTYKYHLLVTTYLLVTGLAFARVRKQPYSQSIKMEQYETIFKGTTLAGVVGAVVVAGGGNRRRSEGQE